MLTIVGIIHRNDNNFYINWRERVVPVRVAGFLPRQVIGSSGECIYPGGQVQVNPPTVFAQVESSSHGPTPPIHSSISGGKQGSDNRYRHSKRGSHRK